MVQSSVMIAKIANISDLTIGLSILAIGTSLPELTTSIISARKEEFDLVFGNIIGSNIVCLLFVLAIPAIFSSNPILTVDLWYELSIMVFITALLWLFSAKFDKELSINRLEGACLLLVFFIYIFQLSL